VPGRFFASALAYAQLDDIGEQLLGPTGLPKCVRIFFSPGSSFAKGWYAASSG
jgi:hypothetical protein